MAKAAGTAVVDIKAEIARQAEINKGKVNAPSGDLIKVDGKEFKLPSGQTSKGPMRLVVVEFVSVNAFWDRPFAKGSESPPKCIAIGQDPKNMVPDAQSPEKEATMIRKHRCIYSRQHPLRSSTGTRT